MWGNKVYIMYSPEKSRGLPKIFNFYAPQYLIITNLKGNRKTEGSFHCQPGKPYRSFLHNPFS